MNDALKRIGETGVVPVAAFDDAASAVPCAKAMVDGGIGVIEITFRTDAAGESIRRVAAECPDMLVGAGTVIDLDQCREAVRLGAKFIVSPGFSPEVVDWCVENGVAVTPGVVTPSEIMLGISKGLSVMKFFPSNAFGGASTMKALSGPFGGVKFVPTGGISASNLAEYAAMPFVFACGGTWLCTKADINAGAYDKIKSLCAEARDIITKVRGGAK